LQRCCPRTLPRRLVLTQEPWFEVTDRTWSNPAVSTGATSCPRSRFCAPSLLGAARRGSSHSLPQCSPFGVCTPSLARGTPQEEPSCKDKSHRAVERMLPEIPRQGEPRRRLSVVLGGCESDTWQAGDGLTCWPCSRSLLANAQ
jgi:hypothetical protein